MQKHAHHSHMMMEYPAVASELSQHQRAVVEDWADNISINVDDFLALMHFSDADLHVLLYHFQITSGIASKYLANHGNDAPKSKELVDQALAWQQQFLEHFSDTTPSQRGHSRRDLFLLGHDTYQALAQDIPKLKYLEWALDLPVRTCIRRMLLGSAEERALMHGLLDSADTIALLADEKRMMPGNRRYARMLASERRKATSKIVQYHTSFRVAASTHAAAALHDLHPVNALVI